LTGLRAQFPNASGEQDDPDGDGMSNAQERLAGTDPTRADSRLAFETEARPADLSTNDLATLLPGQFALYFQSVPQVSYNLLACTNLAGNSWNIATNVTATTTQKRVVLDRPAGQAFYRVAVRP
jgi:hypothetical protein